MKIAFKKINCSWFIALSMLAILVIAACNIWQLYHGHCEFSDFLKIPTIGGMLIAANLVAGLIFFVVKCRSKTKSVGNSCVDCSAGLRDAWVFCPNCGGERLH